MTDKRIGDHKLTKTHIADEAIDGNIFVKLVTGTGPTPHVVKAGAGDAACGVNRDKLASGQLADIVKMGQAYVMAGDNITAGQSVAADAAGKAVPAASTNLVLGQAQNDANTGEFCLVLLSLGGIY